MATQQERLLKAQHDAWLAQFNAAANAANIDYLAMMADIEIPTEEEELTDEREI